MWDAVIVGAGISGLTLAHDLKALNKKVIVIEKSKSVGGRMATRRDENATYDHGAQFYRVKKTDPSMWDLPLVQNQIVLTWFKQEESEYRAASKGMTQISKFLATDLEIKFNEKVMSIDQTANAHLKVHCESGKIFEAQQVFITSPLPQSLMILKSSEIEYPNSLDSIQYAKALVGLFELKISGNQVLPFTYEQNINSAIYSISNQQSKSVSVVPAATVVMTPEWSEDHFENNENETLLLISKLFQESMASKGIEVALVKSQLKKWRYSHPMKAYEAPFEVVGTHKNIFLLGDAFVGPSSRFGSIPGAVDSAKELIQHLQKQHALTRSP